MNKVINNYLNETWTISECSSRLRSYMTVCIVALANDKKKAVLIADKLLTNRGVISYQSEGNVSKIFELNKDVKVMWAGGLNECTAILEESKKSLGSKKTIREIAEHINQKHLEYLHKLLEREHIIGRGINSLSTFYKDSSLKIDSDTRKNIDNILATYTLNSKPSFIVCGKDIDGLHKIYFLNENPRYIPQPILDNYTAIGSGNMYAKFSILFSAEPYSTSLDAEKVKEILIEAKRKAEKDIDVGKQEDIVILE